MDWERIRFFITESFACVAFVIIIVCMVFMAMLLG